MLKIKWSNLFDSYGSFSRLQYATVYIGALCIGLGFALLLNWIGLFPLMLPIWCTISVVVIIAGIRRLHDMDRSGWYLLLAFVPFVNMFMILFLLLMPGKAPEKMRARSGSRVICPVCGHSSSKHRSICKRCSANLRESVDGKGIDQPLPVPEVPQSRGTTTTTTEGLVCPKCSNPVADERTTCDHCGEPLVKVVGHYCSNCGKELESHWLVCPYCGQTKPVQY